MVASLKDIPRPAYTLEEYFALLEASEKRWEFWDGEIVCMSGGSPQHAMICSNVAFAIRKRIEGRGCLILGSDMAIKTLSMPPFRYPDLSIVCGQPFFEKVDKFDTLANPILIVEVLSPATENIDYNEKRLAYQTLPSVQEYLLLAQKTPHVTLYLRQGKRWRRFDHGDLQAVVELSSIQCTLPLQEIYLGIEFN